jgi:hypothetical protein
MLAPPNCCISVALCMKPRKLLFRYVRLPGVWVLGVYLWRESKHKRQPFKYCIDNGVFGGWVNSRFT